VFQEKMSCLQIVDGHIARFSMHIGWDQRLIRGLLQSMCVYWWNHVMEE